MLIRSNHYRETARWTYDRARGFLYIGRRLVIATGIFAAVYS